MYHELKAVATFSAVVKNGSFSGAAKNLGMSPSNVSQQISKLEDRLNVTLLYRSTRALSLTSTGQKFYEHVSQMMENAERAFECLSDETAWVSETIKIAIPKFFSETKIEEAIWNFTAENPHTNVEFMYTNEVLNPISDGVDLVIKSGRFEDSSLSCSKIGSFERKLVATREVADTLQSLSGPEEIDTNRFIHFEGLPESFVVRNGNKSHTINSANGRLAFSDLTLFLKSVCSGLGIQRLPDYVANDLIASGKLVHLFPDWVVDPMDVYIIRTDKEKRNPLVNDLFAYVVAFLSQEEQKTGWSF